MLFQQPQQYRVSCAQLPIVWYSQPSQPHSFNGGCVIESLNGRSRDQNEVSLMLGVSAKNHAFIEVQFPFKFIHNTLW